MKPDGVFSTWFTVGDFTEEGTLTILSALRKHFQFCELRMMREGCYMVACSNHPITPRRFNDLHAPDSIIREFEIGFRGIELDEFFEDMRLSPNLFDHFEPVTRIENTDDHPILEFLIVRRFRLKRMGLDYFMVNQALLNIDPIKRGPASDPARMARRAAIFNRHAPIYFLESFLPLLQEDPRIWKEWEKIVVQGDHLPQPANASP